jgi:hypothetical protein
MVGKSMSKNAQQLLSEIEQRLDHLEEMTYWLVTADLRFMKGDRVRWSARAEKAGVNYRRPKTGRVVEASNRFSMKVLLDGRKHPISAHHMFFVKAGRKR